MNEECHLRWRK